MKNFEEFLNKNVFHMIKEKSAEMKILDDVKWIIMQEEGISEKNFSYINAMNNSFDKFMEIVRETQDYSSDIESFEGKRKQYASEFIYDKYFAGKFKITQP